MASYKELYQKWKETVDEIEETEYGGKTVKTEEDFKDWINKRIERLQE